MQLRQTLLTLSLPNLGRGNKIRARTITIRWNTSTDVPCVRALLGKRLSIVDNVTGVAMDLTTIAIG